MAGLCVAVINTSAIGDAAATEAPAPRTRLSRILVLLATLTFMSACGGGGGSGASSPPPNAPGGSGASSPPPNAPPVASFTATPEGGTAPLTVQFDASASNDPSGPPPCATGSSAKILRRD